MLYETSDSIVGMMNGSPLVICFEAAPIRILDVITKRHDGRWTTALPGEGTIEFLNRDIPNCSRWCFSFIVRRLRAMGWSVDAYATYTKKVNDRSPYDLEGSLWDEISGMAGSIA